MKKNIIFLTIAIIGITIWNIPDTTSLFQGQHTFYNNISVPCQKCHQDIQDILNMNNTPLNHTKFGCKGCHPRDGNTSHAASITYCSKCHLPDMHTINYTDCRECHISHGNLRQDIEHGNGYSVNPQTI